MVDAVVALRIATEIHPEDLSLECIIDLQKICRDVLPQAERIAMALRDPDDPIITND